MKSDAFRKMAEAGNIEGRRKLFREDVTFRSPFVHTPYEGIEATAFLLGQVVQVFENFRYIAQVEAGDVAVLQFEASVGDRDLQGVDIIRFDEDGLIADLTVMIRPMTGLAKIGEEMKRRIEAAGASS